MATAATISIKLDAQTATLRRGFQQVNQEVRGLRDRMSGFATTLGRITTSVVGLTAGMYGLNAALSRIRETISQLADLGDFADRIGINPEQLQAMRATTEQFGGSAEVLNTALQRMTRRAADANLKGGPVADMLERLGVNVEQFARLSPDQQFLTFADAIAQVERQGERTAAVMALMDTEGVALTNTLAQGRGDLEEYMNGLRGLAVVSEESIRQAQEADAAIKRFWEGFNVIIARSVMSLGKVVEFLREMSVTINDMFPGIFGGLQESLAGLVESTAGDLATFDLAGEFAQIPQHIKPVADGMKKAEDSAKRITTEVQKWRETPGVGAVTGTTAAGFSAAQAGRRRANDRQKYESQMLALMAELIRVTEEGEDFVPVTL